MIFVNLGIKNGDMINEKTLPHLFNKDENGNFYQSCDFYWDYDNEYNLIIETTIKDKDNLQNKIEETLKNRKKLATQGIKELTKEIQSINEMLGEG